MRQAGVSAGRARLRAVILPFAVIISLTGRPAWAVGLAGLGYTLNWDQKVDRKDTVRTETRTSKQTLDFKYRGFLSPVIENEFVLKVDYDKAADGKSTVRINPILVLGYKGSYWAAGAKRNVDDTNEPGTNPKTTDSYFVEFFIKPARYTLPDLKGKFNLDQDYQKDATDTSREALTLSSEYLPMDWIQFKGDYTQNWTFDHRQADSDTTDFKVSGMVGIREMFTQKIRFNTEYRTEGAEGWTSLDSGGRSNEKKDAVQTWKNTLSFRPFGETMINASYDWDYRQNRMTGEIATNQNLKVALDQRIGIVYLKADFTRTINEPRKTADDNRKTDDTLTLDAALKFSQLAMFTLKYQDKKANEVHFANPSKDTSSASRIYSGTWAGDLTVFWKGSASYDRTETYSEVNNVLKKTTIDTKYSFKSPLVFKVVNVAIDPTYDITVKEDLQQTPIVESKTTDFKFRIGWKAFSTYNMSGMLDHTYDRRTDSLLNNVQRSDTTSASILWMAPLPNWNVSFDVTRSATDTSGDDLPPDISSSVGCRADFRARQLGFSTSYKYDIKTTTYNSETLDAKIGWIGDRWDISLSYTFTKTFSPELNEGYSIGLSFKYIL